MAGNVSEQLIQSIQESHFYALQLDESTDIANLSNLLAYVRYENNGEIKEEFLFCRSLPTRSTAEAIFDILNTFIVSNEIDWSKCVGVSTDGARAMLGQHSGVVGRVKAVAPQVASVHCSIHRQALATKKMPPDLKTVLDEAVKAVNFIKSRPLQSRLFAVLCGEMDSDHHQLLLHTEVRWLSRGKVLTRLSELRDEVRLPITVTNDVKEHLQGLKTQLREYFPIPDVQCSWIENSFARHSDKALAALSRHDRLAALEPPLHRYSCGWFRLGYRHRHHMGHHGE
uniref:zinc finger BED domain-containing protein 5-like n=1 Tax=Centroberyx gerrardi TaxID=166262 RepID=UPI003AABA6E5